MGQREDRKFSKISFSASAGLSLFLSVILILFLELVLRLVSFQYISGINFAYPLPSEMDFFSPDPDLFWKLNPAKSQANSLGMPGPELHKKQKNTFRLLFLGDSCVWVGYPNGYPQKTADLLNAMPQKNNLYEPVVFAVPGYSSHQGRVLAEKYAKSAEADIVFVSFGWNDHWLAFGKVDSEKRVLLTGNASVRFINQIYQKSRLLQFGRKMVDTALGKNKPLNETRVSLEEYSQNLLKIKSVFGNTPVVFMTPPTSYYRLGIPPLFYTRQGWKNKEWLLAIHREYNQEVRKIAKMPGAYLLDLEERASALPAEKLKEMFTDGIHFSGKGSDWAAQEVSRFLIENNLVPPSNPRTPELLLIEKKEG